MAYLLYFVLVGFHLILCRYLIYRVIFYTNTGHSLLAISDFCLCTLKLIPLDVGLFHELRYKSDDVEFCFWSCLWCYARLFAVTVAITTSLFCDFC